MRLIIAVLIVGIVATACGEISPNGGGGGSQTKEGGGFDRIECEVYVGDLLEALSDLDARLDIGLDFDAYSDQVSDLSVVYKDLVIEAIGPRCLRRVAVPAETAFRSYVEALRIWNRCIGDLSCDAKQMRSDLREKWTKASDRIDQAMTALS